MLKSPKKDEAPEGDPKRGDEILRRMLKTKPKLHKDMVKARRNASQSRSSFVSCSATQCRLVL
jgi:hypothetical protein